MCLRWEALGARASAGDVPRWPPPVQLDVPMVLRLQCNITDDRSSAGEGRASGGDINEQATANDSRIESSGSISFCYKENKVASQETHVRTVLEQESKGACCPPCVSCTVSFANLFSPKLFSSTALKVTEFRKDSGQTLI